jgi:hypothetical protein
MALPRAMLNRLLQAWGNGLDLIWNPPGNVTTAEILAALGTNGGELFARSAALRAFLEQQKPGCTNIPHAGRVRAVTVNGDGTVVLAG